MDENTSMKILDILDSMKVAESIFQPVPPLDTTLFLFPVMLYRNQERSQYRVAPNQLFLIRCMTVEEGRKIELTIRKPQDPLWIFCVTTFFIFHKMATQTKLLKTGILFNKNICIKLLIKFDFDFSGCIKWKAEGLTWVRCLVVTPGATGAPSAFVLIIHIFITQLALEISFIVGGAILTKRSYAGNRIDFTCPKCGNEFKSVVTRNDRNADAVICPGCGATLNINIIGKSENELIDDVIRNTRRAFEDVFKK